MHDDDSPADSRGRLTQLDYAQFPEMVSFFNGQLEPDDPNFITPNRLIGFGMGPDTDIARGLRPGGITYSNFEGFELDLGYANNTLEIDAVHMRDDEVQTFTRIRTGRGNDVVNVDLHEPDDAAVGIPWVEIDGGRGDDRIDASASTLGLQLVGGLGDDRLFGGQGDDLIHGDFGSLDFEVVDRAPVFRPSVESLRAGEGGDDRIKGRGGNDRIFGGAGDDVVRGERGNDILFGDYGRVTVAGANRLVVETTKFFEGGEDDIEGGRGNDFLFGGAENDNLRGNFVEDLMIGEYARLNLEDGLATSIVRLGQGTLDVAASTFFGLYDPRFGPFAAFLPPTQTLPSEGLPERAPVDRAETTPLRRLNGGSSEVPAEVHDVIQGDTLWAVADRYLGDPYRWPEVHAVNRQNIPDPDLIEPGQDIELPREGIAPNRLESDQREVAELRRTLEALDAMSVAEANAEWGFTNPIAVGAGPPGQQGAPMTPVPTDDDAPSTQPGVPQETPEDDGALLLDDGADEPELSGAIWTSLVAWRAASGATAAPVRGKWLRFDENAGRFA
ncbi:MAG: LysM peptidoglycan-binding domain-containing protein [Deltaproteobacteria bacterium]|nr:LysM peptidoglycan-binding domain-containing protein [Deltaproteobacteria bacterium]